MVFFGEPVMWRRPRQTNLKALVNLGSCHSHRKPALAQSIWRCPAFCEGTFQTNMTNSTAPLQSMWWQSFPHIQDLHGNNDSAASALTVAGSIQAAEPFQPSGHMKHQSLSEANLLEKEGNFHTTPLSFFPALRKLGLTDCGCYNTACVGKRLTGPPDWPTCERLSTERTIICSQLSKHCQSFDSSTRHHSCVM